MWVFFPFSGSCHIHPSKAVWSTTALFLLGTWTRLRLNNQGYFGYFGISVGKDTLTQLSLLLSGKTPLSQCRNSALPAGRIKRRESGSW